MMWAMNIYNLESIIYAFIYTKRLDICIFINYIIGQWKTVTQEAVFSCEAGKASRNDLKHHKGAKL